MAIAKVYKDNFRTLERAFKSGQVALLECQDKATGKVVNVIVAMNREDDGDVSMAPFAKMFDGNPFEEVNPPLAGGGFDGQS